MKTKISKKDLFIIFLFIAFKSYSQWSSTSTTLPIYRSGSVAIGSTSNPIYNLQVVAPANAWKARFSGTDGYIDIGPANYGYAHIYTDRPYFLFNKPVWSMDGKFSSFNGSDLFLQTYGTTRLTISNSTGRVGIGTSVPEKTLEIFSLSTSIDEYTYNNPATIRLKNSVFSSATPYIAWDIEGNGEYLNFIWSSNSTSPEIKFWFRLDGTLHANMFHGTQAHLQTAYVGDNFRVGSVFYVNSDGNIGIGCAIPDAKLSVNGKIKATEIEIVSTVPCSDYVFEENYNLKSLNEVELYVKKNKRLPEVPSAEEFKENGYNLGKMDDLLLRKIEEITLYMIELKKENEEMKNENQALKERIDLLEKN